MVVGFREHKNPGGVAHPNHAACLVANNSDCASGLSFNPGYHRSKYWV